MIFHTVPIPPLRLCAETRTPLAVVCAMLALLLLASSAAQAHIFPVRGANVCFAERIGDNLEPAWNVPVDGVDEVPPVADPESSGPISIHFDEALTETTKTIGDDYFDWLDVYVSGLSLGQSVVIERFLVDINPRIK